MKLKKLLALGLAAVMTMSVLSACGSTENKGSSASSSEKTSSASSSEKTSSAASSSASSSEAAVPEKKEITFPLAEPVTIKGEMGWFLENYKLEDNIAWKEFLKLTNIDFDVHTTLSTEVSEKWQLMLASGDYPEFFWRGPYIDCNKYGMDGLLIPLEDLIREYMPNLTALLDEINGWYTVSASDGHIYSLPAINVQVNSYTSNGVWWINQVWLDNLKLEYPTNAEELYTVLKAFKEQDANGNGDPNDEIPMMLNGEGYRNTPNWFFGDTYYYAGTELAVTDAGETIYYPTTDACKEWLSWMNKCYEEGIIWKDTFVATEDTKKATTTAADILGVFCNTWPKTNVPVENENDYVALMPFDTEHFSRYDGLSPNTFAITDKCENPEILLAAMDYFYTAEGYKLCRLGVEGDSYVINADGTFAWTGKYENYQQYKLNGGTPPLWMEGFEYYAVNKENDPQGWLTGQNYAEGGLWTLGAVLPSLKLTEEQEETYNIIATDLKGYISNFYVETITGVAPLNDTTWKKHLDTLKAMGAEEYLDILTDAYKAATGE